MSGGSHNYLFSRRLEAPEFPLDDVRGMAGRLRELGFEAEAQATLAIAERIEALNSSPIDSINRAIADLSEVWHAVEWLDSCDSSIEEVNDKVRQRRAKQAPAAAAPWWWDDPPEGPGCPP